MAAWAVTARGRRRGHSIRSEAEDALRTGSGSVSSRSEPTDRWGSGGLNSFADATTQNAAFETRQRDSESDVSGEWLIVFEIELAEPLPGILRLLLRRRIQFLLRKRMPTKRQRSLKLATRMPE